jgi:hypothetical protein
MLQVTICVKERFHAKRVFLWKLRTRNWRPSKSWSAMTFPEYRDRLYRALLHRTYDTPPSRRKFTINHDKNTRSHTLTILITWISCLFSASACHVEWPIEVIAMLGRRGGRITFSVNNCFYVKAILFICPRPTLTIANSLRCLSDFVCLLSIIRI